MLSDLGGGRERGGLFLFLRQFFGAWLYSTCLAGFFSPFWPAQDAPLGLMKTVLNRLRPFRADLSWVPVRHMCCKYMQVVLPSGLFLDPESFKYPSSRKRTVVDVPSPIGFSTVAVAVA